MGSTIPGRIDPERLLVDVAGAIRDGQVEPAEFADVDRVLGQLDAVRREAGRASVNRILDTAELVRDLVSADVGAPDAAVDTMFGPVAAALGFRRALFSTVDDGRWWPACLFVEHDLMDTHQRLREYLVDNPIDLHQAQVEGLAVSGCSPHLVTSPHTHSMTYKPLMSVSDSHGYVVAPVICDRTVVGMVHADRFDEPATAADLERVSFSTQMMAVVAERMARRRRLAELATRLADVVTYAEEVLAGRAELGSAGTSTSSDRDVHPGLTVRQHSIMRLLCEGATNVQIARELGVSEGTVKTHVRNIYRALGVRSRAGAAAAYRAGLDSRPERRP
ncbi:helix-turn-helix domain-containing protein [Gordonia sp. NPDC003376]